MRDLLLVLWIALLGATGIDFLGGEGPLLLTPFLVLSPIVVLTEGWRIAADGWRMRLPEGALSFLLAVSVLLAILLLSTFASYDLETSARRFALLLVQIYLVFLGGMAIANRPDPAALLVRGAYAGLLLFLAFDVVQAIVWIVDPAWAEPSAGFLHLRPDAYFGVIPRLTGASHDPNLGGLLLVFYIGLVLLLDRPSPVRGRILAFGALSVVATLSRSAVLAGLVFWGARALRGRDLRLTPKLIGGGASVAALIVAAYLTVPGIYDPVLQLVDILQNRLTLQEGSTSEHLTVVARGWAVGTASLKQALVGIGYGNAFVVLQDIYPGNVYGNFHSMFVTLFAEAGAGAALLGLWIFAQAIARAGAYRPLVLAMLAYNLFQQAHTDHVLWLTILLAWTGIALATGGDGRSGDPAQGVWKEVRRGVLDDVSSLVTAPSRMSGGLLLALVTVGALGLGGCSEILTEPYRYGAVEVVAVRRSEEPVPGVRLVLFTGTRHLGFESTGEDGRALFDFVPAGSLGVYATPPAGYRPLDLEHGYVHTFGFEEGEKLLVAFTYLKIGPGSVTAEVRDAVGKPLEGVRLELFSPVRLVAAATSGSVGTHTFSAVPFGEYGVRALPGRGYTVPSGMVTRSGLLVEEGVEELALFTLERCRGSVRVLTVAEAGDPVRGAPVTLYEATGHVAVSSTGQSGERIFPMLPCGDYGVRVAPVAGYRLLSPAAGYVDGLVLGNEAVREARFTFATCRGTIRVLVVDDLGAPVSDAELILYQPGAVVAQVRSGPSGRFDFGDLPCRLDYAVKVTPPGGYAVTEGRGSSYLDGITVETGSAVQITFRLVAS